MLNNHLSRFLRDERGSYTIWSLVWFMLYVAIGGLTVDMTDGYRNQTLLAATADAASLAAVTALPDKDEAVAQALNYAANNMGSNPHGTVLTEQDVFVGTWHFATETFTPDTAEPNAVYVVTRRAEQNANPLALNFLRILALFGFNPQWDINTEAVAVRGIHVCHNNSIIAGGRLFIRPGGQFLNNICLIGRDQFWFNTQGVYFQPGVYAGAGCSVGTNGCIGPGGEQQMGHETFQQAFNVAGGGNYSDPTSPANAENVGNYTDAVLTMADSDSFADFESTADGSIDYSGWEYLFPAGGAPTLVTGSSLPETIEPYTIYHVTCSEDYTVPSGTYEYVAIITECRTLFSGDYTLNNALFATRASSPTAIQVPATANFYTSDCTAGGIEIYAPNGGVNFAAGGQLSNMTILAKEDIKFAGNASGPVGLHVESQGDVEIRATPHSEGFGLCPNTLRNGPSVFTYSLVR